MGGMMIFYAFYTGASTGESILLEEERRTLQRLFMTPTSQASILAGKFLAVFLTVLIQIGVLLTASGLIFGIRWGQLPVRRPRLPAGDCYGRSFVRKFPEFDPPQRSRRGDLRRRAHDHRDDWDHPDLRDGLAGGPRMGETVALLVPQGWAAGGLLAAMDGQAAPARAAACDRHAGMVARSFCATASRVNRVRLSIDFFNAKDARDTKEKD